MNVFDITQHAKPPKSKETAVRERVNVGIQQFRYLQMRKCPRIVSTGKHILYAVDGFAATEVGGTLVMGEPDGQSE